LAHHPPTLTSPPDADHHAPEPRRRISTIFATRPISTPDRRPILMGWTAPLPASQWHRRRWACRSRGQHSTLIHTLEHIDETLLLFAPDAMLEPIRPKVYEPREDWASHGEQTRRALDILRRANGQKLSTRQIALRVMEARGLAAQTVDPAACCLDQSASHRLGQGALRSLAGASAAMVLRVAIGPTACGLADHPLAVSTLPIAERISSPASPSNRAASSCSASPCAERSTSPARAKSVWAARRS